MTTGDVEIYTTETCPYCKDAKKLLVDNEIKFNKDKTKKYTITSMSDLPESVSKLLPDGHSSVPVIIAKGKFIGGFDDLTRIFNAPQIRPVLR